MTRKLYVAAPFGNYLSFPGCVSVSGSFTVRRRAGFFGRVWRAVRTIRYDSRSGAWFNRMGLPSPGLSGIPRAKEGTLVSLFGFDGSEWTLLFDAALRNGHGEAELNLSCPNVNKPSDWLDGTLRAIASERNIEFIAKLPPVGYESLGNELFDLGIRKFHLCNTVKTERGGMSGKPLKPYSIAAINWFRGRFGREVELIGGGGISCVEDVTDYLDAGADHVSIGSMLFDPFSWRRIRRFRSVFSKWSNIMTEQYYCPNTGDRPDENEKSRVEYASDSLRAFLGRPLWLTCIGIAEREVETTIILYTRTDYHPALPEKWKGFRLEYRTFGDFSPLGPV